MTIKDLDAFFDAGWNRHDVDFLMTLMSEDCVFESAAGPDICGTRHEGRERVREAFARVFKLYPDAHFGKVRHFIADGGRPKGRGERLRHLHVPKREDRRQECLPQEPHDVKLPPSDPDRGRL